MAEEIKTVVVSRENGSIYKVHSLASGQRWADTLDGKEQAGYTVPVGKKATITVQVALVIEAA